MQGSRFRVYAVDDVRVRRSLPAPRECRSDSVNTVQPRAANLPDSHSSRITVRLRKSHDLRCVFALLFAPVSFALCTTS